MDKRNRKNETADKKTDYKVKDRGDLKKVNDKMIKKCEGNTQANIPHPERGDSECKIPTNLKTEKIRLNMKKTANERSKSKYLIYGIAEKEFPHNRSYDKDVMAKSYSDLRKRIRDRYTVKLNGQVNKSENLSLRTSNKKEDRGKVTALKTDGNKPSSSTRLSDPADRPKKQLSEETTQTNEKLNGSSTSLAKTDLNNLDSTQEKVPTKPEKLLAKPGWKIQNNSAKKRKPMIKTIMSKNGSVRKYFKAVTFVDQRKTTPLEIKIPSDVVKKQQKVSKFTETCPLKQKPKMVLSKASILQENLAKITAIRKKMERKVVRKVRHLPSPEYSIIEPICPQTEVAKWAPASVDAQTKPYYEAWVNTTLAAISTGSKKDKLSLENQAHIMRSFRRALELERPISPELYYAKCADENYTGKIKIRKADRIRKK